MLVDVLITEVILVNQSNFMYLTTEFILHLLTIFDWSIILGIKIYKFWRDYVHKLCQEQVRQPTVLHSTRGLLSMDPPHLQCFFFFFLLVNMRIYLPFTSYYLL